MKRKMLKIGIVLTMLILLIPASVLAADVAVSSQSDWAGVAATLTNTDNVTVSGATITLDSNVTLGTLELTNNSSLTNDTGVALNAETINIASGSELQAKGVVTGTINCEGTLSILEEGGFDGIQSIVLPSGGVVNNATSGEVTVIINAASVTIGANASVPTVQTQSGNMMDLETEAATGLTTYAAPTAPTIKRRAIFANGIPLVITEGSSNRTLIYYDDGTGNPDLARGALDISSAGVAGDTTNGYINCDRGLTVYGGCDTDSCSSTKITMKGGTIYEIRGGGNSGDVTGDAQVTVTGGKSYYIRGGGSSGNIDGNTNIDISNHIVQFDVNGGGLSGHVRGNVTIKLGAAALVTQVVYGGGWSGGVDGNVTILMDELSRVEKGVYGSTRDGDTRYPIGGDISILMKDDVYAKTVSGTDPNGSPVVNGNITIEMRDSASADKVVAATQNAVVDGDITLRVEQKIFYAGEVQGGKDKAGKSTSIILGDGVNDAKFRAEVLSPGTYDSLLLRKNALIVLNKDYETSHPSGTQQIKLEDYTPGARVLYIDPDPTMINSSSVELFQIVQPEDAAAGTWYIDATQTTNMGLLQKSVPTLTTGLGKRLSATTAQATFIASETGVYYYAVSREGDAIPTVNTDGAGTPCSGTAETQLLLSGISDGAQVVSIVMKDRYGTTSNVVHVPIPHRSPFVADPDKNTITGIVEGQQAAMGELLSYIAMGVGADNTQPINEDERYNPTQAVINAGNSSSETMQLSANGTYKGRIDTKDMQPGEYSLTVSFDLQQYEQARAGWVTVSGGAVTRSVNFTVKSAPSITDPTEAKTITVTVGRKATFAVKAAGTFPLSYQWQINKGNGWVAISGATNDKYTSGVTKLSDNGYKYRCTVTNTDGSAISPTFTLKVIKQEIISTGDNSTLWLWIGLGMIAFLGLCSVIAMLRRRKK